MEAARTSETLVNFYQTTRRYNLEDSHLRIWNHITVIILLQAANSCNFVKRTRRALSVAATSPDYEAISTGRTRLRSAGFRRINVHTAFITASLQMILYALQTSWTYPPNTERLCHQNSFSFQPYLRALEVNRFV
jgi:hypothetical protein